MKRKQPATEHTLENKLIKYDTQNNKLGIGDGGKEDEEEEQREVKKQQFEWRGDNERKSLEPYLRPLVNVCLQIVASYIHVRFRLVHPHQTGNLERHYLCDVGECDGTHRHDDTDNNHDEDYDNEEKPFTLHIPLKGKSSHSLGVFEVAHLEDGEGTDGSFASYQTPNFAITRISVCESASPGTWKHDHEWNGVCWSGNKCVIFDEYCSLINHSNNKRIQANWCIVDEVDMEDGIDDVILLQRENERKLQVMKEKVHDSTKSENRIKIGNWQVIGVTTDKRFVCAWLEDVPVDFPKPPKGDLAYILRSSSMENIFSNSFDDLIKSPMIVVIDTIS